MKLLQVLVCGGDSHALQEVAQKLSDEGVKAETSTQVTDRLCRTDQEWDLLLVDLDAMTNLLRGLLPAIRRQFPHVSVMGIVNGSPLDIGYLSYDLELDGYMFGPPKPEDLIVRLPHLAANYLYDANTSNASANVPVHAYQEIAA
jgi:DNA-binding response OmpR family regulator